MRAIHSPMLVAVPAAVLTVLVALGAVSTLAGCVVHPTPPAAPAAAPTNRIRTDGIYECRGVEVPVSSGGWPFLHPPPTTARWAYFLRFSPNVDGETRFVESREPITTAEALSRIKDGGGDSGNGKTYIADDDRVHIVFPRPFPRYADGTISDGQLILKWNTGPGPQSPSVFRFVRWP